MYVRMHVYVQYVCMYMYECMYAYHNAVLECPTRCSWCPANFKMVGHNVRRSVKSYFVHWKSFKISNHLSQFFPSREADRIWTRCLQGMLAPSCTIDTLVDLATRYIIASSEKDGEWANQCSVIAKCFSAGTGFLSLVFCFTKRKP